MLFDPEPRGAAPAYLAVIQVACGDPPRRRSRAALERVSRVGTAALQFCPYQSRLYQAWLYQFWLNQFWLTRSPCLFRSPAETLPADDRASRLSALELWTPRRATLRAAGGKGPRDTFLRQADSNRPVLSLRSNLRLLHVINMIPVLSLRSNLRLLHVINMIKPLSELMSAHCRVGQH